ncbi:MAG TPA: ISNCY family transposase [Acidimicrobiales bacterium]|jgi:transposase|nr:ISNCY family transposase [Acidimicrobiales bacterium]
MESRIDMSQHERDVLVVMNGVLQGERTQSEAARLLHLTERQVRRIQRRLEAEGDGAVVHRLRGRPSNRQLNVKLREQVLKVYEQELSDFGPTLASEVLEERGLVVSPDTLRRWLIASGLWKRQRRRDQHRSRRPRRECFGELVQMDASIHPWLEGRGEEMVLVTMIDDATNRLMARFYESETVEAYFDLVSRWLAKYGRPVAFYTDHDSIFETTSKGKKILGTTQFSRAAAELEIELILAGSPQAKGRVERNHGTNQDRWVKLLRLAGVTTRAEANAVVDRKLLPDHNRRFTKPPGSPTDAHRPLGPRQNVAAILSIQESRLVGNDYTVRFHNRLYQLHKPALPGLRLGRVVMEQRLDGSLAIRFGERYLAYTDLGPPPPKPGSLSHRRQLKGSDEHQASAEPRPSTVTLTNDCSGRTSAELDPVVSTTTSTPGAPYRPPTTHPWRRKFLGPTPTS